MASASIHSLVEARLPIRRANDSPRAIPNGYISVQIVKLCVAQNRTTVQERHANGRIRFEVVISWSTLSSDNFQTAANLI